MLEARVKQLKKQAREDFRFSKSLMVRLVPFLRKEVVKKEVVKKEVTKKESAKKEVAEKEEDDDEED
jgi:hypothetical protein